MITSVYGNRRRVSLEFRIVHVLTGENIILYPGQLADFCRKHQLNYGSAMGMRKNIDRAIPLYPVMPVGKFRHPGSTNRSYRSFAEFIMLPAKVAQIQP